MALSDEVKDKFTFVTQLGKLEVSHHPFRFTQTAAYFQQLIYEVLRGSEFALGYLDDILIFSSEVEMHLWQLHILLDRLREGGLNLEKINCNFLKGNVQYLGHLV